MKPLSCPSCNHSLTFWNVSKAATPLHLKCDKCKTKLRIGEHAISVLCAAVIFGAAIWMVSWFFSTDPSVRLLAILAGLAGFELAFYLIARAIGLELRPRE